MGVQQQQQQQQQLMGVRQVPHHQRRGSAWQPTSSFPCLTPSGAPVRWDTSGHGGGLLGRFFFFFQNFWVPNELRRGSCVMGKCAGCCVSMSTCIYACTHKCTHTHTCTHTHKHTHNARSLRSSKGRLPTFQRVLRDDELPASVDWRGTGADGPVKDQVRCIAFPAFINISINLHSSTIP